MKGGVDSERGGSFYRCTGAITVIITIQTHTLPEYTLYASLINLRTIFTSERLSNVEMLFDICLPGSRPTSFVPVARTPVKIHRHGGRQTIDPTGKPLVIKVRKQILHPWQNQLCCSIFYSFLGLLVVFLGTFGIFL